MGQESHHRRRALMQSYDCVTWWGAFEHGAVQKASTAVPKPLLLALNSCDKYNCLLDHALDLPISAVWGLRVGSATARNLGGGLPAGWDRAQIPHGDLTARGHGCLSRAQQISGQGDESSNDKPRHWDTVCLSQRCWGPQAPMSWYTEPGHKLSECRTGPNVGVGG